MKKYILIILSLILCFYGIGFSNVGPLSLHSNGGVFFDEENILSENISVKKENITVQVLSGIKLDDIKSNGYVGLNYLYDLIGEKGFSKSLINKFLLDIDNLNIDLYSTMFYKSPKRSNDGTLVNFQVEYELQNESNKKINNQLVGFSSLKVDKINPFFLNESLTEKYSVCKKENENNCDIELDNLLFFYPSNKYPQDLNINFGDKELSIFDRYQVKYLNNMEIGFFNKSKDEYIKDKYVNNYLLKKIPSFYLSFNPYEIKTLKINYKIPLNYLSSSAYGLVYNFEPIFRRKNNRLDELNIKVVGDKNHILNSSLSNFIYLDGNIYKDSKYIDFKNYKKDIYEAKLEGLKDDNLESLRLAFNSYKDLSASDFCGVGLVSSNFFCEEYNYKNDTVELSNSPYFINIKQKDTGDTTSDKNRYKVFDVLK